MPDARDAVIEALADSERTLAETAAGLRAALHAALGEMARRDGEIARLREQHHALIDEFRRARESMVRRAA